MIAGILPMLFWAAVLGLIALVCYVIICIGDAYDARKGVLVPQAAAPMTPAIDDDDDYDGMTYPDRFEQWLKDRYLVRKGDEPEEDTEITSTSKNHDLGIADTDAVRTSIDTDTTEIDTSETAQKRLTERDTILLLAAQKDGPKWRYSGNKIFALVGGNRNEVMKLISGVRGEKVEGDEPQPVAYTPFAGRPYNPKDYYQDEPALQYQPPTVEAG